MERSGWQQAAIDVGRVTSKVWTFTLLTTLS